MPEVIHYVQIPVQLKCHFRKRKKLNINMFGKNNGKL